MPLALHDPAMPFGWVDLLATSCAFSARNLWISGYPERAVKMQARAVSRAAELSHVATTAMVQCLAGALLEQLFGNAPRVLAHTKVHEDLSSEHKIKAYEGVTTFFKGWAMESANRLSTAIMALSANT